MKGQPRKEVGWPVRQQMMVVELTECEDRKIPYVTSRLRRHILSRNIVISHPKTLSNSVVNILKYHLLITAVIKSRYDPPSADPKSHMTNAPFSGIVISSEMYYSLLQATDTYMCAVTALSADKPNTYNYIILKENNKLPTDTDKTLKSNQIFSGTTSIEFSLKQ